MRVKKNFWIAITLFFVAFMLYRFMPGERKELSVQQPAPAELAQTPSEPAQLRPTFTEPEFSDAAVAKAEPAAAPDSLNLTAAESEIPRQSPPVSRLSLVDLRRQIEKDKVESLVELVKSASKFDDPKISADAYDGSVFFFASGYLYRQDSRTYVRMALDRSTCAEPETENYCIASSIETPLGTWEQFDSRNGNFTAAILNNDPYQVLFRTDEKYVIRARWTRRNEKLAMDDYSRAVIGYVYEKQNEGEKSGKHVLVGKFILVDHAGGGPQVEEQGWPPLESLRPALD